VLVVEPCPGQRRALLDHLLAEGYQSIGTSSMRTACTLGQARQVRVVIVNLSAFSTTALRDFAQAIRRRRNLLVLATVTHVSLARNEGETLWLLRISDPGLLPLGSERCRRN
jgi:hypothetical protein